MRFVTSLLLSIVSSTADAQYLEDTLRAAAQQNGYSDFIHLNSSFDPAKAALGEQFFEDETLSYNGDISCQTCHLDDFSSADGLPYAIGVGGDGEGAIRAFSDGEIIPRNTFALWGRGGLGFDILFWDGKVEKNGEDVNSQFGMLRPSEDPLVVAVHLPFVEIREMVVDDHHVTQDLKTETIGSARQIYSELTRRALENEEYRTSLTSLFSKSPEDIEFLHIAESVANFIRDRFQIRESRFSEFMYRGGKLTEQEVRGGLIFYGKGKCSSCHSGPYFTDFDFHSVPFPQAGFGKNGFGIDYGRFNVTHHPQDLYKFRTPPLINVELTGPYSHSGSIDTLEEAVIYHFDPLRFVDTSEMDGMARTEYYKRIISQSPQLQQIGYLSPDEIDSVISFLRAQSFID